MYGPVAPLKSLWDFSRLSCGAAVPTQAPFCQVFAPASPALTDAQFYTYGTNVFSWVAGVEDAENWHGKPMPKERADAIIKLIESQIQTKKNLDPKPPIEDSPEVNITDIELSSPDYEVGEQVGKLFCSLLF